MDNREVFTSIILEQNSLQHKLVLSACLSLAISAIIACAVRFAH